MWEREKDMYVETVKAKSLIYGTVTMTLAHKAVAHTHRSRDTVSCSLHTTAPKPKWLLYSYFIGSPRTTQRLDGLV